MKKHFIPLITAALLLSPLLLPISAAETESLDNFIPFRPLDEGETIEDIFTDVDRSDWFYDDVKFTYEYFLMSGKNNGTFDPDGNLTIAETLQLAMELHQTYRSGRYGEYAVDDEVWYRPAVVYAAEHGITAVTYPDYNAPITRGEFAKIIGNVFPEKEWEEINAVDDDILPDISDSDPYGEAVYRFYRAGILMGNDEKGTFAPDSTIKRSETAAILHRMVEPDVRRSMKLTWDHPVMEEYGAYLLWNLPVSAEKTLESVYFTLSYLDDDNIPELVLTYSYTTDEETMVFTLTHDGVTPYSSVVGKPVSENALAKLDLHQYEVKQSDLVNEQTNLGDIMLICAMEMANHYVSVTCQDAYYRMLDCMAGEYQNLETEEFALADLDGDDTPELIFNIGSTSEGPMTHMLYVYTWENGEIVPAARVSLGNHVDTHLEFAPDIGDVVVYDSHSQGGGSYVTKISYHLENNTLVQKSVLTYSHSFWDPVQEFFLIDEKNTDSETFFDALEKQPAMEHAVSFLALTANGLGQVFSENAMTDSVSSELYSFAEKIANLRKQN